MQSCVVHGEIFDAWTEVTDAIKQRKYEKLKKSQAELIRKQQQEEKHRTNDKRIEAAQEEQQQQDSENALRVLISVFNVKKLASCIDLLQNTDGFDSWPK